MVDPIIAVDYEYRKVTAGAEPLLLVVPPAERMEERWRSGYNPQGDYCHVCVVARGMRKDKPLVLPFISSLLQPTYLPVTIFWVNVGEKEHGAPEEPLEAVFKIADYYSQVVERPHSIYLMDLNSTSKYHHFPSIQPSLVDNGYVLTYMAIEMLLEDQQVPILVGPSTRSIITIPRCQYFLVTDSKGYYMPEFFPLTADDMRNGMTVIGVNLLSWRNQNVDITRTDLGEAQSSILGAVLLHRDVFDKMGLR